MALSTIGNRFSLGQVVITQAAHDKLKRDDVQHNLVRHLNGDWGELNEFDWEQNERAVGNGGRLMSRYSTACGTVYWIITEHDRSVTTILLPMDY